MVNLAQVIKLKACERREAAHRNTRLTVWRKRLLRLESWMGILDGKHLS